MPPPSVEFWYEFASTYSYPAAMRIERECATAGVSLVWRPFLLGPIFQSQGWDDSPFNLVPAKGRYMWRDVARVCAELGLEFRRPSRFPRNGLLAARIACLDERWCGELSRRVYRANFVDDREIDDPTVLGPILDELGLEPASVLDRASLPETKERLRLQTERAAALGIFGAPSFTVDGELFWGNDRLEAAVSRATDKTGVRSGG